MYKRFFIQTRYQGQFSAINYSCNKADQSRQVLREKKINSVCLLLFGSSLV